MILQPTNTDDYLKATSVISVDPEKGELFIYNMVFADPVPQVVDVLSRYQRRSDMWKHLPPAIDDELLCAQDRALNATLRA